jgi:hypothetical protein
MIKNAEQERFLNDPAVKERLLKLIEDAKEYHNTLNRLRLSSVQLDGESCECCRRRVERILSQDASGLQVYKPLTVSTTTILSPM